MDLICNNVLFNIVLYNIVLYIIGLLPTDTPTTKHHFHFGPAASFFLDPLVIAFHSSPIAYWTLSDLGELIFRCHIFFPFHTVHGVLLARILKWFAIPPPLYDFFFLSEFSNSFISNKRPLYDKTVFHERHFTPCTTINSK